MQQSREGERRKARASSSVALCCCCCACHTASCGQRSTQNGVGATLCISLLLPHHNWSVARRDEEKQQRNHASIHPQRRREREIERNKALAQHWRACAAKRVRACGREKRGQDGKRKRARVRLCNFALSFPIKASELSLTDFDCSSSLLVNPTLSPPSSSLLSVPQFPVSYRRASFLFFFLASRSHISYTCLKTRPSRLLVSVSASARLYR